MTLDEFLKLLKGEWRWNTHITIMN
jgi:hypothetical protein